MRKSILFLKLKDFEAQLVLRCSLSQKNLRLAFLKKISKKRIVGICLLLALANSPKESRKKTTTFLSETIIHLLFFTLFCGFYENMPQKVYASYVI